jgi:hypothetical protein
MFEYSFTYFTVLVHSTKTYSVSVPGNSGTVTLKQAYAL